MEAELSTVFVVDRDVAVLGFISRALRASAYAVETFTSPPEFLQQPYFDGPGCMILDLHMPEMMGLEWLALARSKGATLPLIFIAAQADIATAVRAIKAGAIEFLEKPLATDRLLEAVEGALEAHRRLLQQMRGKVTAVNRFNRLTPRERQVCLGVGKGMLNKQIAFELGASEKTIKLHRARVMRKLAVNSVAELVDLLFVIGEK